MIRFLGSLVFIVAVIQAGNAAGYPVRPIRYIAPNLPGGPTEPGDVGLLKK